MTSHIETSLGVVRIIRDAGRILNITNAAEQSHAAAEVLSLTVEVQCVLRQVLGFQVLGPPFVQSRILQALDERLQAVDHVEFSEHSGNFSLVSATLNVVLDGTINFMNRLKVLGHLEVRVF